MKGISVSDVSKKRSGGFKTGRTIAAALLALTMAAAGVSCTAKPHSDNTIPTRPAAEATVEATPEASPEAQPVSDTEAALAAYREIAANADKYDYGSEPDLEVKGYSYALVMMQSGDAVPTLLIAQLTGFGMEYVRVFRYDPETGKVVEPVLPAEEGPLMQGAGSAGGFRGELSIMEDGSGIAALYFYSGTGEGTLDRISAEGDTLTSTQLWSGSIAESAPFATRPIENWYDVSDSAGFENRSSTATKN